MAEPRRSELKVHAKRVVLVGVRDRLDKAIGLEEIAGLAETAGAVVVGELVQVRDAPDAATYLGKGKLAELKELIAQCDADLIVFDNYLSPAQGKRLEEETGKQVVDRSEVILDIFATHARTHEARLQVELAQLLYMRPRLTRMWTHLERIEGGIGSGRGPGEKQLETDRRLVDKRIAELQRRLKDVERRRSREVAGRREHLTVSLVGYTNAGKSTLFNRMTRAEVFVEDRLFATLDATTRQLVSPERQVVLLTDTVGFIRKLPHHLVASFHSTLVEAIEADLLLHVVDAADPDVARQMAAVEGVLGELLETPRPTTLVFNKCDRLDEDTAAGLRARHPGCHVISARTGAGLEGLKRELWAMSAERAMSA